VELLVIYSEPVINILDELQLTTNQKEDAIEVCFVAATKIHKTIELLTQICHQTS
jgi:hypothetical protein